MRARSRPGSALRPCDFDAAYTINAEGELRAAVLSGAFYPDTESMTYTLAFEDYGTEPDITAP